MSDASRLALGTAQLAGRYGVANAPAPSRTELNEMLELARAARIDTIDTAAAYGRSEELLGSCGVQDFAVITKLPPDAHPADVTRHLDRSLERLRVEHLSGVLVHRFEQTAQTLELLAALRGDARVRRTGVSVYHPHELEWLLAQSDAGVDIVQLPFNVLDQRFRSLFDLTTRSGIEIHARSAFLQGLLLLELDRIPDRLKAALPAGMKLRELAVAAGRPVPDLLVSFVRDHPTIAKIVVGVESAAQLREHIDALATAPPLGKLMLKLRDLAEYDEDLLTPSRWQLGSTSD